MCLPRAIAMSQDWWPQHWLMPAGSLRWRLSVATPWVGAGGATVRLGFLRSLMSVRPAGEPENFDVCPVLLAHPEIDPWTPVELSRPFIERIPAPKTLEILQGCGHFPMEDLGRGQLESALRTFVESVL
jgi:alpha-beta hydrolase superfamily lysophospholipase